MIAVVKKQYQPALAAFLISAWALYLRWRCLAARDLWNDEVYQIGMMTGPFKPFWQRLVYGDFTCFPGDYLLNYPFLKILKLDQPGISFEVLNHHRWGLAIPHIVATILGFYLLYLICRQYYKTLWGYIVAFGIVCFNQNLIFHSFEFRPYAVLPTLALASFYLSGVVIRQRDTLTILKKILIGIFFIAIIWFHAFGILIVGSGLLFYLLDELSRRSWRDVARSHFKFLGIIFIIALPVWIWYATGNPLRVSREIDFLFDTFKFIPSPAVNPLGFLKAIVGNLMGEKKLYFLLVGLALGFILPHSDRRKQIMLSFAVILVPITALFLNDLIKEYMFLQRQFVWVMPLFAFFLGWCWDSLIIGIREKLYKSRT